MKRANTPWQPVSAAQIEWTDAGKPHSTHFSDVYYSRDNGLQEGRYLFLQGNELPGCWQRRPRGRFCIAETGFGTGLNFLLTWQSWRLENEPKPDLHYLSVEKHPLARAQLARALTAWPELEPLGGLLLAQYPDLVPGQHRVLLDDGRVTLDLWWEDVADALADLASRGEPLADAWYLDGFAPARNPAMWQPAVLQAVAALSRPGASFATFTAAGQVRRDLEAAGFKVEKIPGYGRKRECLRGHLARTAPTCAITQTPWDLDSRPPAKPQRAIVLGAGLAGCTAAAALARRGIDVTLLERGKLAGAGSANDQGILYTRLSHKHSALTDFALQSFCFAARFYRELFHSGQLQHGLDGELCGSFHQVSDRSELATLASVLATVQEFAQVLDSEQARQVIGLDQPHGGYWYPQSGWLRPASVCRAQLAHSPVRLLEDCGEISIVFGEGGWRIQSRDTPAMETPCLIVAAGAGTVGLAPFDWLPLQAIRGQTTDLPAMDISSSMRAALCHEGYIAPARKGLHCIGATFDLRDNDRAVRTQDHRRNLTRLGKAVPAWRSTLEALDPETLTGRVGYRCASPDYLPLVGPAPDVPAFLRQFASLRENARQTIPSRGEYMPGLYLNTAHGSRGLASSPLAAELLASQICGEPLPLSRELSRALAPARFLIRDLCRNRI